MNFIDIALIRCRILYDDIGKDTDPLEYLQNEGREITDKYTKQFFQSMYGIVAAVFWSGSLITLLISLGRYMLSGKGNERKEHQMSVVFKVFLMATFIALPGFISFLMKQL